MRPIVVPDSCRITLKLNARDGEAALSLDNRTYRLNNDATIELSIADESLILATPHNNTFYDTLREKMMWGVDNR
jgi:NAD+ kinase